MKQGMLLALLCAGVALLLLTLPVQATATTEVHVVKYASDEATILSETTVSYQWMEENLPVQGDGSTHYFFQGPIFEDAWNEVHPNETWDLEEDKWNPSEDVNVLGKDLGAVKGTDVKDLCDLVGGMSGGDTVEIKASDGFYKRFPYSNVYEPDPRQGPMVVTWYTEDATESGEISGYVPDDYSNGMRLVFLADAFTNPWGKHVFGISDMRACLPEDYWHYYQYPDYPASTGYTVKYIDRILIYSTVEPPELSSIEVSPTEVTLDVDETQQFNATAYDADGNEMPNIRFSWTSSDETVGTIDDYGLFIALADGETTITAANGTVEGTATVTVHEEDSDDNEDWEDNGDGDGTSQSSPVLTTINVSPPAVTLNVRDTQQFNASGYDQTQNQIVGIVFNWTIGNETVGTVNNTGFFTTIASGTTTIKATNGTVNGTANVTVFTSTPTPTPTETPPVNATPSPSPTTHPIQTHSPSATVTATPTPAVTSTPTPSVPVPGFETISALVGLFAVAYVTKRRKK